MPQVKALVDMCYGSRLDRDVSGLRKRTLPAHRRLEGDVAGTVVQSVMELTHPACKELLLSAMYTSRQETSSLMPSLGT